MRTKVLLVVVFLSGCISQKNRGRLAEDTGFYFTKNKVNDWGISIKKDNRKVAFNEYPITIEVSDNERIERLASGYSSFSEDKANHVFIAKGKVAYKKVSFDVRDE